MKINYINPIVSPNIISKSENDIIKSGLIAEYRFDENKGQFLKDYSGYNKNGLIVNGEWNFKGLNCNGDDYIQLDGLLYDPSELTVTTIFKRNTSVDSMVLFGHRDGTPLIQLTSQSDTEIRFQLRSSTSSLITISSTGLDTTNNFIHATGVFNKTKSLHKLFAGSFNPIVDTTTFSDNFISTKQTLCSTYAAGYAAFFSGTIAYALIYNRALSTEEIKNNYLQLKNILSRKSIVI